MLDRRHHLGYAALAAVYVVTALMLLAEGAPAHAGCALAAALIYAALCLPALTSSRSR